MAAREDLASAATGPCPQISDVGWALVSF